MSYKHINHRSLSSTSLVQSLPLHLIKALWSEYYWVFLVQTNCIDSDEAPERRNFIQWALIRSRRCWLAGSAHDTVHINGEPQRMETSNGNSSSVNIWWGVSTYNFGSGLWDIYWNIKSNSISCEYLSKFNKLFGCDCMILLSSSLNKSWIVTAI